MIALAPFLGRLRRAERGAMAVETAIVAPVLVMLSLGGVEAGSIVARQSELQSAAAEALNIVQAVPPTTAAARTTVEDILEVSTDIDVASDVAGEDVAVVEIYRCGTEEDFLDDADDCAGGGPNRLSTYVRITITDTYTPTWTEFGIGSPITYNVVRTVQIS